MDLSYKCLHCGRIFKNTSRKASLMNHIRMHSRNKSQYPCTYCDCSYQSKDKLMKHMKIHVENPFQCLQCDMKFSYNSDLIAHTRTHTVEAYLCKQCGIAFSDSKYLQQHMDFHTTEKEYLADSVSADGTGALYKCKLCNKSFKGKFGFTYHVRKDHASSTENLTENTGLDIFEMTEESLNVNAMAQIRPKQSTENIIFGDARKGNYSSEIENEYAIENEVKKEHTDEGIKRIYNTTFEDLLKF